jgi:transcriptional regulator with XRE-family HTH domain
MKHKIGHKIRRTREQKKITMRQLAKAAHVTESLISQIERNLVSPAIDTLLGICDMLQIDMAYLFRDYKKTKEVIITPREKRVQASKRSILYEVLLAGEEDSVLPGHNMEAYLVHIEAGGRSESGLYGHEGREFGFVLKGRARLEYNNTSYAIKEGDSIVFAADLPHVLYNDSSKPFSACWVITPAKGIF